MKIITRYIFNKINYISMIFLSLVPLITALASICVLVVEPKLHEFNCSDLVQDSLDCDVCWCYEEGGFGCFCCTACHDRANDRANDNVNCYDDYDDSSDSFQAYAKKS